MKYELIVFDWDGTLLDSAGAIVQAIHLEHTPEGTRLHAASDARKGGVPLVVLTAYTTPMARLVDAHCDIALVGDSLGQVIYGLPSTVPVTLEMMAAHGAAGG